MTFEKDLKIMIEYAIVYLEDQLSSKGKQTLKKVTEVAANLGYSRNSKEANGPRPE